MPVVPYRAYDHFAWFYSRGWGSDFHSQAKPVYDNYVFPRLPPHGRVLDLCCGSGDLSRILADCGYRVTGIDGSEEMLRYAREQAPAAEFRVEDARTFDSTEEFDAVLCTFDSLNHIVTLAELQKVICNVHRALTPGGLFVFDLNMAEAFETLWQSSFANVEDAAAGIFLGSYDDEEKMGRADVTLFRLEGSAWRRFDVTVFEKCYSNEEVTEALERAGFMAIEARDAWELGMRGEVAIGREFFFASRPPERTLKPNDDDSAATARG